MKDFSELRLADSFMFLAVMQDANECRAFLSRILEMNILEVEVRGESTLVFNPNYHGVRLDVEAEEQ